ncbi:MAG: phosphonate C-P lyase system protein PhnH [Treponema sp.]|jgi:alpha-D-ribose 1-methylphosphonate 5-triphosphate synthase subunit PhnH|nr:phosphonate C-P lyase system protein PhnH [Treponema sp.]
MKNKHAFDMVHGTQEVFRILLEALANPGRVLSIGPYAAQFAGQGRWLAPAVTLLDKRTGFYWEGDPETGEEIRFLTGAPRVSLEEADFVFLNRELQSGKAPHVFSRVKGGTHIDPHMSALLFIDAGTGEGVVTDGGEKPGESVFLSGPGIPPEGRHLDLFPAEVEWCRARDDRGFEYPCGVELVFLREDCSLAALTRKTAFTWGSG